MYRATALTNVTRSPSESTSTGKSALGSYRTVSHRRISATWNAVRQHVCTCVCVCQLEGVMVEYSPMGCMYTKQRAHRSRPS